MNRSLLPLLMICAGAVVVASCRQTELAPFRCDDVQTVMEVMPDQDVGLGFTAVELADLLRTGRSLDVVYETQAPPSGESGAQYAVAPSGAPFDVLLIDRTDIGTVPPGACLTGRLMSFSMHAALSFPLAEERVSLPLTNITIEAHGISDDRVMLYSNWSIPIDDAPTELARQARLVAAGRHDVAEVSLGLNGRFNPHDGLEYRGWRRSTVSLDVKDDRPMDGGAPENTGLAFGLWYSPDDTNR